MLNKSVIMLLLIAYLYSEGDVCMRFFLLEVDTNAHN